jgi:kynurenine formamidase
MGLPRVGSSWDRDGVRVVDLTHPYDNGMPVFPGLPEPLFEAWVDEDGWAMTHYSMLNHIGTHVDAPAHQIVGGDTLDEIGLERLVTEAVTIDVSRRSPHGAIPLSELEPELDRVRAGDIVLLFSDNGRNYGSGAYWTGWSYPDAEAARAFIERGISAIGFDGPSADPVDTTTFALHRVWLGAGRMILENVANLDQLPERAQLVVAPMKVARANGAPVRIFALLPE